jgi:aminoglycoside phosphotransferase (APT) family kinase protein
VSDINARRLDGCLTPIVASVAASHAAEVGAVPRAATREALEWAAGILGSRVAVVRGLREGGTPWLLRTGGRPVILKDGEPGQAAQFATEAAALQVAATAGFPVAAVLGYDGGTRMLLECLPGTSRIPREPDGQRLRALGATAARIQTVGLEPTNDLPVRDRPIADADYAGIRRAHGASGVLLDAEEIVASSKPADERGAFVHGDLWHGNTMWQGDVLSGILDWDSAGAGPAGVDLCSLRWDAAVCFGIEAADVVLAGWEEETGRPADNVSYWDAVAALSTPPDMAWAAATIADQGRPDLDDGPLLNARRDAFLRQALSRLGAR